jgi:large subunit ribosomal protein L6
MNLKKTEIKIPNNVNITLKSNTVFIKGFLGQLQFNINNLIEIVLVENNLKIKIKQNISKAKAIAGLTSKILNNMILGVSRGFLVKLQLVGTGYRAYIENNILYLKVGYSHLINYKIPEKINILCMSSNIISIFGIDRQLVNQVASEIRNFRKPEPYKGKGIRYHDEIIQLKERK